AVFFNAARTGDVQTLKQQIDNGQDINAKQNGNVHAIGLASLFGHVEAVELLIKNGANVNQQTKDGGTALHGASFLGRVKIVETLLRAGANVKISNSNGMTPINECSEPWNNAISEKVGFLNEVIKVNVLADEVKAGRPIVLEMLKEYSQETSNDSE
ncbi:MAG: ankyrin repeat domain-containing protein, partial [Planctomycetota bacterium]|nr:ankyrin repeat domain-containing protein [Planctomycetota bacterium]